MVAGNVIASRLTNTGWKYPNPPQATIELLEQRIADAGTRSAMITYSDLFRGVDFIIPGMNGGKPFQIEWKESWERALVGELLGRISVRSSQNGFMASALVVNKSGEDEGLPSRSFFQWAYDEGIIPNLDDNTKLEFWNGEVQKAFEYYRRKSE